MNSRARVAKDQYCKFVEMNKELDVPHPRGSSRAKTLWKMKDAKDRGDAYCDETVTAESIDGLSRNAANSGSVERHWLLDGGREQELGGCFF